MQLSPEHKTILMTVAFVALATFAYVHVVDRDPDAARRVFFRVAGAGIAFAALYSAWIGWSDRGAEPPLLDEPFPLVTQGVTNPPPLAFSG